MLFPKVRFLSFRSIVFVTAVGLLLSFSIRLGVAANAGPGSSPSSNVPSSKGNNGSNNDTPKEAIDLYQRMAELQKKVSQEPQILEIQAKLGALQKEYIAAMEAAIDKEEPGIVEKVKALQQQQTEALKKSREQQREKIEASRVSGAGVRSLTSEERRHFIEVRSKAMQDPAVREAKQTRMKAKNPATVKTTEEAYKKAMRSAMLKADSKIKTVLDKMDKEEAAVLAASKATPSPSPSE